MVKHWCLASSLVALMACETAKDRAANLNEEPNPTSVEEAVNGPEAKDLDPDAVIPSDAASPAEGYSMDGPAPEPTTSDALDAAAERSDMAPNDDVRDEVAADGETGVVAPKPDKATVPSMAATPDVYTVLGKGGAVRAAPHAKGKVLRMLKGGATVKVLAVEKGWAKIGANEWMPMTALKK